MIDLNYLKRMMSVDGEDGFRKYVLNRFIAEIPFLYTPASGCSWLPPW